MIRPLTAVIAEDEPLATRRLEIILAGLPDMRLLGSAADGRSALDLVRERRPDVLFVDIKMPGLSGLELVDALPPGYAPAVIFVTAFGRYGPSAFDRAAVDYLLKPVEFERLGAAVRRARERLEALSSAERIAELQEVIDALRADGDPDRPTPQYDVELWIPERQGLARVPLDQVERITAEREYVRVHLRQRSYLLREALTRLEQRLDPAQFLRIHRSVLVRIDAIARIARASGGGLRVVMAGGEALPVGRSYAAALRGAVRARNGAGEGS